MLGIDHPTTTMTPQLGRVQEGKSVGNDDDDGSFPLSYCSYANQNEYSKGAVSYSDLQLLGKHIRPRLKDYVPAR